MDAATGRDIFLLGEGWNFGEIADGARFVQASQLSLNGSGIGTFSDRARDFVRGGGPFDGGASLVQNQGFVNGLFYDDNGSGAGKTRADLLQRGRHGQGRARRLDPRLPARPRAPTQTVALQQIDYNGQPAGYVTDPQEVVNYVENHDNQTLFDINVYKLPLADQPGRPRARRRCSAPRSTRSARASRTSTPASTRCAASRWTATASTAATGSTGSTGATSDNGFGAGAPMQGDNGDNWSIIKPLLANPDIKPTVDGDPVHARRVPRPARDPRQLAAVPPAHGRRDQAAADASTTPAASRSRPSIVGHLDGQGYPAPASDDVLYFVNVDKVAHTLTIDAEKNKAYQLHPVHRAAGAADRRPAEAASYEPSTGAFAIPPRTAVVYVVE